MEEIVKIKNVRVNGFANLENREFNLKQGINLIQGKNEAGKTSLLKFIIGMLYGLSKNKNGKDISDYDKYKPWKREEYSGKLVYELNNGESYEIYREFNKKNPQIYNENAEEISKQYTIDKNKGNQFFYEQTRISEDILIKTAIVSQTETKLEKNDQNILLQKISNLVSTGDDTISYKKAIEKLSKKQMLEVGTQRSVDRPINIVREKIKNTKIKLEELEQYNKEKKQIDSEIIIKKQQIQKQEKNIELLKNIKQQKEKECIEQEKININKNTIFESEEKIEELEKSLKNQKMLEKLKINKMNIFIIIALFLVTIVAQTLLQNKIITIILGIVTILNITFQIYNKIKKDKKIKNENQIIKQEISNIKREIEIMQKSIEQKEIEIEKQLKNQREEKKQEKELICNKYKDQINEKEINEILELNYEELIEKIDKEQKNLNELKIANSTQEINLQNILQKLEELAKLQEIIEQLQEQEQEIMEINNTIIIVKEALEQAYEEMKKNITPEFTKRLGEIVEKTSNGKYTNIKFNDINGLTAELETGEYVNCEKLSIGTIDQMYLALRLSALKEVTQETMPIILDEAFVYYDEERLKNILEYIQNNYKEHQIIILSCTDREEKVLKELNIKANICKIWFKYKLK